MAESSYAIYLQNDGSGNWGVQVNKAPSVVPAGGTVLPFTWLDNNNGQDRTPKAITSASNATPVVLTVASGHGVVAGDELYLTGQSVSALDGTWIAGTVGDTTIALQGSVAAGASTGGTFIELDKTKLVLSALQVATRAIQNDRSLGN